MQRLERRQDGQGHYFGPSQQRVRHVVARAALIAERFSATLHQRPPAAGAAGAAAAAAAAACRRPPTADPRPPATTRRRPAHATRHGVHPRRQDTVARVAGRRLATREAAPAANCSSWPWAPAFPRPLRACAFHIGRARIPARRPKAEAPPLCVRAAAGLVRGSRQSAHHHHHGPRCGCYYNYRWMPYGLWAAGVSGIDAWETASAATAAGIGARVQRAVKTVTLAARCCCCCCCCPNAYKLARGGAVWSYPRRPPWRAPVCRACISTAHLQSA
jgi:hypothetical protein